MRAKSFRKFVEDKEGSEDPQSPYLKSLEDELGIDPRDLEKDPQVASFFSMDGDVKNLGLYRIVKLIRDDEGNPTHAVVKTMEDGSVKNRRYRDEDGTLKGVGGDAEEKTLVVPIEDLDKLMSQDFQPPPQAPGGMV